MITIKHTAEKLFLYDPVNGISMTYRDLFTRASVIKTQIENKSWSNRTCLLILKDYHHYMPVLIACWSAGIKPAVYSPNAKEVEYSSLIKEFGFEFLITDLDLVDKELSKFKISPIDGSFEVNSNIDVDLSFSPNDIGLLLFSSGTSGKQKCIPLSFDNLHINISAFAARLEFDSASTFLCGSPLWHAHGLYNSFLTAFFLDATVIYSGPFSPLNIGKLFDALNANARIVFHITPSMLPILLMYSKKKKGISLPGFHRVISGTSFLDVNKKRDFEETYNIPVFQQYGMTETLFMTINDRFSKEKPNSVGSVIDDVTLEVVQNGIAKERFQEGSIRVRSGSCFGSYFGDSPFNESFKDGYFYTGDIGYLDDDNYLFITGREKDLIKKGGFSIAANTISELITNYCEVDEAYTIGVNDPVSGEEIYSFYLTNTPTTETDIKRILNGHLERHFIPKRIFKLNEFPKTDTGKIVKSDIEKILITLLNE